MIHLLDLDAEFVLVTDPAGELRGVVAPRDFAVSPTTAGVSLHEQLRHAASTDELVDRAHRAPDVLADLLERGLATGRVIAVYSSIVDTLVRRAITLTFAQHPELDVDAFTWLSLGSNGRREAVLSSDVDCAVAFHDDIEPAAVPAYRAVFAEVEEVLTRAGVRGDRHGATASHPTFARTNAQWRAAAEEWLAAPVAGNGAMMTSLLVDGRPIHGDPGLPAATAVFGDLRAHPGTMRLLLEESLSYRARMRSWKDLLTGRPDTFYVKAHAVLPVVNLARWAALAVGSPVLPTVDRLRAASGLVDAPEGPRRDARRGLRPAAADPAALPAVAAPARRPALGPAHPRPAVVHRPQRGRRGGPRDRRHPAPDDERGAVRPRGGVGRGGGALSPTVAG